MGKDLNSAIEMKAQPASKCRQRVDFTVPADAVKSEADKATRDFANYAAVPGFRKGKAPTGMLRQRFAKEITEELKRRLISTGFEKFTKTEADVLNCTMASDPEVDFQKEYNFALNFDLAPEIQLGEYKNLTLQVEAKEIKAGEVDERVKMYRSMYGTYADTDEAAQAEDMLKVSYTSDFVLPEDANPALKRQVNAETNYLWLKEPEAIPGATAALTGAKKGDVKEFSAAYPADFHEAALQGKTVNYKVTVEAVQRRKDLSDEELCARVGAPSLDEFKKMLLESMQGEAEQERQAKLGEAAYSKLDEQIPAFELPESLLDAELNRELRRMAEESVKSDADAEEFKKNMEANRKQAETVAAKALRRSLILRKIGKLENISVEANEMQSQIQMMSRYYGYKAHEFQAMLEKTGGMDELQLNMVNGKVLAFLVENRQK